MREMIHRLKYGRELTLAPVLGRLLNDGLADERIRERVFDGLVPVPLFATREREREFNQSEILARQLQKRCKLPIVKALRRIRSTTTQTHFDRRMRMQNLRDAFALRQNVSVQGQKLLLVDDVFTTGSTLDECARVLREGGAHSVCALTLARG
jgi:ComF family protein